jgi:hypothetical protein
LALTELATRELGAARERLERVAARQRRRGEAGALADSHRWLAAVLSTGNATRSAHAVLAGVAEWAEAVGDERRLLATAIDLGELQLRRGDWQEAAERLGALRRECIPAKAAEDEGQDLE